MTGEQQLGNPSSGQIKESKPYPGNDRTGWLWGWLLHAENTFNNHTNFFLVAESMLVVSYVTVPEGMSCKHWIIAVIVLLGLLFTLAWLCVQCRAYQNIRRLLMEVEKTIPGYREVHGRPVGLPVNFVTGIFLPIVGMVQVRLTLLVESSYWISNSSAKLPEKRSSEGFWCLSKATFGRKAGNSGPGPGKVGDNLFMLEKEVSI